MKAKYTLLLWMIGICFLLGTLNISMGFPDPISIIIGLGCLAGGGYLSWLFMDMKEFDKRMQKLLDDMEDFG